MKKPSVRLFSLLLTLAFLISCTGGMALNVRAAENDTQYEEPVSGTEADAFSQSEESLTDAGAPAPVTAIIEADVSFCDWDNAESFSFLLTADTEDAPMPEVPIATASKDQPAPGWVMTFDHIGDYEYTVTQINEGAEGVTYDTVPRSVIVSVTMGEENALSAEVFYAATEEINTKALSAGRKGDPEENAKGDPTADPVQAVKDLLAQIDSLQEMQDKKIVHRTLNEFNLKKPYYKYAGNGYTGDGSVEIDNSAEHKAMQQRYAEYVENMFALRAEAKEAFDALTPEQQSELLADDTAAANYAKLTPYDKLDTVFPAPYEPVPGHNYTGGAKPAPQSVPLPVTPSENEYTFETTMSYEMSQNFSAGRWKHQAANFSIFTLIDVSGPETEWSPDRLYEYNNCNYDLAYCCDANTLPHRSMHYKRVNLEDSGYYTEAAAQHIRAIANISYPFVNMDEMKQLLIERGFPAEKANALTRSDMISAVQMAIWSYSNISTYLEPDYLENITRYGGTTEMIRLPDARYWLRTPTLHDYRNEMWIWYNSNTFPMENSYWAEPHWTFYDDIQDRVDSLVQFLHNLDPVAPAEDEIVISDVNITRSAPIDQDGTYMVDLSISLNHGAANGDVTITITSSNGSSVTGSRTITVDAGDTYSTSIIVKDGDRVDVVADGTQVLPRSTYFYLPEAGAENSQALVGVAEGETRVHAEDSFEFHSEGDLGLRILKTVKGSSIPLSGITLHAYTMEAAEGELPQGDASEADIAAYVKPENLAATVETDSTGYAYMELSRGTYIIVEELNAEKVKEVVPPFYANVPAPAEASGDDGEITIEHLDIAEVHIDNPPRDIPGTVSVYLEAEKQFNDWGKAGSFSFKLEAVTPGAPMPKETVATAVEGDPVAVFPQIVYDAICFESGDPQSDTRVFEYTITEIDDGVEGVTYDTTPHAVSVTVTRSTRIEVINQYGDEIVVTEYTAEVAYDGEESLIITNTFSPAAAHFEATKEINDWSKAESFTFVLEAVTSDAPMPKETTATATEANPTAVFETLNFDKAGTYEYTITEIDDHIPGVTYDTTPHAVVVTVSKGEGNVLSAAVTYDGQESLIITNTYTPPETRAEIKVTKRFTGRDWKEDDVFIFHLASVTAGAPMPPAITAEATRANPVASFGFMSFTESGTYEYQLWEEAGKKPYVSYDTRAHTVIVTVSEDAESSLTAAVTYDGADSLTVTNRYAPPPPPPETQVEIEATKQLAGRAWQNDDVFIFHLAAVTAGAPMPPAVTAEATRTNPVASFGSITYTEPGTYEYQLWEEPGKKPYVSYDTSVHKVTVTVTWDARAQQLRAEVTYDGAGRLTVTNTYAPPPPPKTGDTSRPVLWLSLMAASLLGILVMLRKLRRPYRA